MISYPNALDDDDVLTNISSLNKERKSAHYWCLGCGKEMTPVLGKERARHFRHLIEGDCNPETYLHEYSKRFLARRFETASEFFVSFFQSEACAFISKCTLYKTKLQPKCDGINDFKTIDLKKIYDTAQVEGIYGGFKADVLLTNKQNPKVPPLFLEVKVSHPCSQEKINSKIKIIEIEVQKEEEVERPLVEFNEKYPKEIKNKRNHIPYITFYNFDRTASNLLEINKFFVCNNGENGFEEDPVKCASFFSEHHQDAVFEIGFIGEFHDKIIAKAFSRGFETRHCSFCSLYGECMIGIPGLVYNPRTGKKEPGIRKLPAHILKEDEVDKHQQAKTCPRWKFDLPRLKKAINKSLEESVLIWRIDRD